MSKKQKTNQPDKNPPKPSNLYMNIRKPLFELELHVVGGFLRGKNLIDRLKPKGTSLIPEGAKVHIEAFLVEEVKD